MILKILINFILNVIIKYILLKKKGKEWYEKYFLKNMGTISKVSLLATLVYLFMLQGGVILSSPIIVIFIAIPLTIQTFFIFGIGYNTAKMIGLRYDEAAPAAMIGASNHFEVAIATAVTLFGLRSGAALATVVGILIEVPVMLMLVRICLKTKDVKGRAK